MTPEQALAALQTLYPSIKSIRNNLEPIATSRGYLSPIEESIEWPDGVTEWPIPEKWRDARRYDALHNPPIHCRVRNGDDQEWIPKKLCGYIHLNRWITAGDINWQQCQVIDNPSYDPIVPCYDMSLAPKDKDLILRMGNRWFPGSWTSSHWSSYGESTSYDSKNQPTAWFLSKIRDQE